jgi:hypothetical protein
MLRQAEQSVLRPSDGRGEEIPAAPELIERFKRLCAFTLEPNTPKARDRERPASVRIRPFTAREESV